MAVQSDGKIVVAGRATIGSTFDFALARYNADGSLDTSFGTGGKVTTAIGTSTDEAYAVALQSDGKIVVGGRATIGSNFDFALARYNTDGTLDTSFGTSGKVTTAISSSHDEIYALAIQPDGAIVAAGRAKTNSYYDFALARYTASGVLDTSFDTDGKLTTAIGTRSDEAYGVALQADGKIVAAGRAYMSGYDFAAVRYNSDGSLDTSFDTDGKVTTKFVTSVDEAYAVAIQADSKIVLAGRVQNGSYYDVALARYNTNGSLDTSFDTDGKVTTSISTTTDEAYAVAVQSDAKIVVAGRTTVGSTFDFALARYTTSGGLDSSFGTGGMVSTAIGTSTDEVYAIAIQPDAKIVVAGRATIGSNYDFAVARYQGRNAPVANAESYSVNEDNLLSVSAP
ncbi:MAG TPA: delta-60 repeat domain-containing protein, partial [Planctomycetaceae bacterium]|nr:delta-60 repeat domain-containing protein [Planctomycetaceae bacterium]